MFRLHNSFRERTTQSSTDLPVEGPGARADSSVQPSLGTNNPTIPPTIRPGHADKAAQYTNFYSSIRDKIFDKGISYYIHKIVR